MAIAVFDADVLIAYLGRDDAHHAAAVERVRNALEPGSRRIVSAVNYSEVMIGPLQAAGGAGAEVVDSMFDRLAFEIVAVDIEVARHAAGVRASTKLKLPDAYAVATAIRAGDASGDDVRLETFDKKVIKAYADLLSKTA
jgi:predicted nucleic acid-binding protein